MRRKVTLYVGGRKADLSDTSFLLMNYTAEDLSNPTIVKNSFSRQVTLPGTCRNNRIFGAMWRADRESGAGGSTGSQFNPSKRTSFALYSADGIVMESGYLKLDEVVRKGVFCREYKVSLFGGLGEFFFNLSQNQDGSKKTLADLDYLGLGENELDFTINAATVQEAWDDLYEGRTGKWRVINFMPAYEGIPENFSADRGIVAPVYGGLQDNITYDGETYTTRTGIPYTIVKLPQACDEWAAKDLRSYLQRPAISMKAVLEAIAKPENNGGYEFDFSAVASKASSLWKTLPLIPSLGTFKETTGSLTYTFTSYPGTTASASVDLSGTGDLPSGAKISVGLSVGLSAVLADHGTLTLGAWAPSGGVPQGDNCVIFVQAVAYSADLMTPIAASKIRVVSDYFFGGAAVNPSTLAEWCEYVPQFDAEYDETVYGPWNHDGSKYVFSSPVNLTVEGYGIEKVYIWVHAYQIRTLLFNGSNITKETVTSLGANPHLYRDFTHDWATTNGTSSEASPTSVRATSSANLRSGAYVSKRLLLTTDKTPAEYLISLAKIFGWMFVTDPAEKKVTLMDRDAFYQDETIDLTKRVDTSQGVQISPFAFSARWYDFKLASVGGAFADEYKSIEGREYGIQRVNTGYEFDANSVDLLSGNAYKSAVTVLESSKYWNIITEGGMFRPSPFVDPGGVYTLWTSTGKAHDFEVNQPMVTADIDYYNSAFPGYDADLARKMQFHGADGKAVDGSDVLVFREGWETYQYFKVTDDVAAMDILNDGKPCWLLQAGSAAGVRVPIFQRYTYRHDWIIDESLDFGAPAQIDIPGTIYDEESTIYFKYWKKYLGDRYDKDTKVMTCKVDLSGLQVGQDLLRKFYWYDGALWVLNKIVNHSLTTYGPTECEFVQVRDKDNYLNGQD